MKHLTISIDWESPTFGKYRRIGAILILFALFFTSNVRAQGGCSGLTPSFINYEPCKYRVQIVNTSDCFTPTVTVLIDANAFETWSANTAGGWTGQELAPNIVQLTHSNPFMPIGISFPMIFTLPPGITTLGNFNWEYTCFPGESCTIFPGIELTSCNDPKDASIIGVKYRECGSLPYTNQTTIPDWTIQLLDVDGNVLREQVTDAGGAYSFYDLPLGNYIVKEAVRLGWTPKFPASGMYAVTLNPSQQAVRNFGNCPECSCDSIKLTVQPISNNGNACCYRLIVQNQSSSCFPEIRVEVDPGLVINSWSLSAPGWTVIPVTPQSIQVFKPGSPYIPAGTVLPITFCVTGGSIHNITVATRYSNGMQSILCEYRDTFDCSLQGTCPNNYVQNGNFEQGTPPGPDESIGFAPSWSAIWTGCTSTADFYNTVFPPPFALPSPMPASQGNFGGMWAKPNGSNLVWREGMMNQIIPIAANSGTYNMTAKFACLTPVKPTPSTPLPVIEVWGVPVGPPTVGTCPGLAGPNSAIFPGALLLGSFMPTATCDKNFQTFNNFTFPAPNVALDRIFLTRQQPAVGQPGSDVYVAIDDVCLTKVSGGCECKAGDVIYTADSISHKIPCMAGPNFPVFFCPTGPVTIAGNFGCVDPNGNPCPIPPAPINWTLYHNGIVQQGTITTGSPWSLPFTAADLAGSGFFTLSMTTLCPGQVDSCKCVATWFQECSMDTCECGPNPWDLEFRYGGAQNIPVQCGQTLNVTTGSAFYPKFNCQGPANCGRVDWFLTGPDGYLQYGIGVAPGPGGVFVISDLQPTNFIDPGTYTLQMIGICGQDTCPCTVYFCLPPPPPTVNDASICRTLQSVYIPLQDCPTGCDIAEVQWFIKPCSASNWPTTPYQVSSAGNPQDCDDLLFLPYQYPNETCVQVYAIIKLDPGCCMPDLTSNIATITLCNPISCNINNPNTLGFCQTGQPLPLIGVLSGANCNYTVEWYNDAGQLVSNSLTYTPPVLNFPSGSTACYKDFTFTLKVIGICGASTCSTTIRVYNINSDNGDLVMDPLEPQPFCPGEDARLTYLDKCSGPPPKWLWYSSTVLSGGSGYNPLSGTGMMNPTYYTNQLYQTTWYMVESQNGVCPPQQDKLKIEVKSAISITNFTAVPDPCVDNYVVLTVGFTPTPITGAGCQYVIDWYYNGNLIHTSTSLTSSVSYTYPSPTPGMGSVAGVYYAVVKDNCCPGAAISLPIVLNPTCVPAISGPCYVCDKTTQFTLYGDMVLPPQDPCPPGANCTYQWYRLDITTGLWVPVGTPNSLTFTTMGGGHFRFESICDYGYGPCIRNAYHDVAQCVSTGSGCMYVDAPEVRLPIGMQVEIHPNPTTGSMTVQINPTPLRKGHIEVVDVNGKVLISDNILENQASHTMSLSHLPNGLYFVRVFESDLLLWVGKIVRSE